MVLLGPHLTDMPGVSGVSCGDQDHHQHGSQRPFSAQEDTLTSGSPGEVQRAPWLSLEERGLPRSTPPSPEKVILPLGPILGLPPSTHWSPR